MPRALAGSGSILHPRIAQEEDFLDGFLDEVVRATGSGGDADGEVGTGGEPFTGCDFFFGVDIEVPDRVRRVDAVRIADEVGREFLLPYFDEVRGVGAVVAADDQ